MRSDEDQDGRLLETAQVVVQKKLADLQTRERDLQQKVEHLSQCTAGLFDWWA